MDCKFSFLAYCFLVLVPQFAFCETDPVEQQIKQETQPSPPEIPFLTVTHPYPLMVMMERSVMAILNYTVSCDDTEQTYVIETVSTNTDVLALKGNTTFMVSCKDSVELDRNLIPKNISENEETSLYSVNNTAIRGTKGSVQFEIQGILLGMGELSVKLKHGDTSLATDVSINSSDVIERRFSVVVIRLLRPIDSAFRIIIAFVICLVILGFGCGLNLEVVKECLKKPIAPGIGLGCQYVLMPLIGFAVAKLVPVDNNAVTFGIFVCGVCPGGGASNIYSYLLGGDVHLSITMTLISNVAALGMMPLWIYTLGRQFVDDDFEVFIPYINMIQTLAMLTVPLVIGILIKIKFPKAALKFVKILKPVTIIIIIAFIVLGVYTNLYIFKLFRPEYVLAGALLPYFGYIAGGIVAAILRQPWTRIKTIALETGMQNIGVAFFMMLMSFPPPLGDIAAMAPAASGMMTPLPPLLVTIPYLIYNKCTRKYDVVPALTDREIVITRDGELGDEMEQIKQLKNEEISSNKQRLNSDDEQKPMIVDNISSV